MRVLLANNTGIYCGYLAGRYPGLVGHLYSPGGQRGPYHFMPYALDNGKFPCWSAGKPWDELVFIRLCEWARLSGKKPAWVLVPDEVADCERTLDLWQEWSPRLKRYGWPLAFAAQDGHTPSDVPKGAEVVFVGGTTEWKRKHIKTFCRAFPRVHVGRINTLKWLTICQRWGAESCDGTGWFRGDKKQIEGLEIYLEDMTYGEKQIRISAGLLSRGKPFSSFIGDRSSGEGWPLQGKWETS